jgi:hypothetical protein
MVFHMDSRFLQLKPSTFAISARGKLAVIYEGNFMRPRVPWGMRRGVNPGLRNFVTRLIKHWQHLTRLSMTGFWGSARFCGTNCGRDLGTKKSVKFSPIYLHASSKETDEKSVIFAEENMTALLVLPFIPNRYPVRAGCITIRSQP